MDEFGWKSYRGNKGGGMETLIDYRGYPVKLERQKRGQLIVSYGSRVIVDARDDKICVCQPIGGDGTEYRMPKSEPIQSFLSFNEAFEYACELVTAWARINDLAYPKVVVSDDSRAVDLRRDSLVFKADMDALQKLCEEFIAEGHKIPPSRVRLLPSMKDAIAACEGLGQC